MATNLYSPGRTAQHTASGAIASGDVVPITDRIGIAVADIADAEVGTVALEGAWTIAKTTGTAWTVGQRLWWNTSTSKAITTPTAIFAGYAGVAAASGDTTGVVILAPPVPSNPLLETTETFTITDDDNAASVGVALKVIWLQSGLLGLMSENAGNADVVWKSTNDLDVMLVQDSTAAAGVALYYYETDDTFRAALPGGVDGYLQGSSGRLYKVTYEASPSGVALYCDDDASIKARVRFVSPTNASGTVTSETVRSGLASVV